MYIPPFWCGVASAYIVLFAVLIVYTIIKSYKR
nr:MAG TPA: hypothetical protein [Caudoviricetes sp.]